MPDHALMGVDEHLALILDRISELPAYDQPLLETLGLPAVADIASPLSLPVFDNSAMDGYAVAFRDVAEASAERPVHLPVVGEIAAGQTQIFAMSPGTAVRIMTGAPVPTGCTAVVPVKGTHDVVKEALSELGTVTFREVAMQPGKPQGFGVIGEDDTPIFTLPGNPVSSYVSFEVFVVPALRRMMGKLPYRRPMVRATLTQALTSPLG